MPNTLNRAYPFPNRTETPDVQLAFQRLAEALDVDITAALSTLPYRAASLADLNAKTGMKVGDRGVIAGATNAIDNGEYSYTGTGWKQQNVFRTATLEPGWDGLIRWSRSGRVITVLVDVGRTAAGISIAAYDSVTLAKGLPAPDGPISVQSSVQSPRYEFPAFSTRIGTNGFVQLVAHYAARQVDQSNWFRGQLSYQEGA